MKTKARQPGTAAEWHGKRSIDVYGEKIGKLQDVYVDIETDVPQFATVKEGFIGRHLTFVPLGGILIGPDDLQVKVTKDQVRSAPDIEPAGRRTHSGGRVDSLPPLPSSTTRRPTARADAVSLADREVFVGWNSLIWRRGPVETDPVPG